MDLDTAINSKKYFQAPDARGVWQEYLKPHGHLPFPSSSPKDPPLPFVALQKNPILYTDDEAAARSSRRHAKILLFPLQFFSPLVALQKNRSRLGLGEKRNWGKERREILHTSDEVVARSSRQRRSPEGDGSHGRRRRRWWIDGVRARKGKERLRAGSLGVERRYGLVTAQGKA